MHSIVQHAGAAHKHCTKTPGEVEVTEGEVCSRVLTIDKQTTNHSSILAEPAAKQLAF
jgi:hypothetical protein